MVKLSFKFEQQINRILLNCFVLPVFILGLCAFLPQRASAANPGYDIKSYSTEITIDTENVYHVAESISVNFTESSHGIFRYIPYRQEMLWDMNGITKRVIYRTPVNDINVQDEMFSTYRESGNLIVKIGDPEEFVSENKVYNISYSQKLGNDKIESLDFVYYNLVGTHWDTSIDKVSFKITLPKNVVISKLSFFSGGYSLTREAPVQYTVDNNTISGTLNTKLGPGEGLTIQLELPEGYFDVPPLFPWKTFFVVLSVSLALLSLILFFIYGRDPMLVKTVEFYPPDGITSAEAGYIIDTSVDDNDVVSLIIFWAEKGFLSIEQISRDDFRLTKLKDIAEEQREYEKQMFGQLFYNRETVTVSELQESFYVTIDTTKNMVAELYKNEDKRLYDRKSSVLRRLIFMFSAFLIWSTLFYALYIEYYSLMTALLISLGSTVIIMLPFLSLGRTLTRWNGLTNSKRTSRLIINIILGLVLLLLYICLMFIQNLLIVGITVAVFAALINAMSILMRKRTKYGNQVLGKLLGFRNFLNIAEKNRLQKLVEENPSYFYDVMPFAYVLGVSDKWAKKFEGIAMRPPEWYQNSYSQGAMFSPFIFQLSLFQSLAFMQTNMVSRPLPQTNGNGGFGGGGFGGGGFSGGGFGGGGGGRW